MGDVSVLRHLGCVLLASAIPLACATSVSGDSSPPDAAVVTVVDARPLVEVDAASEPGVVASSCPANQFGTGFDAQGRLVCSPIDTATKAAVNEQCTIYSGWRDSCDGCTSDPVKWGQVSSTSCQNGVGAGNTCTVANLGGEMVNLFGLDLDGDVNDDDKFYMGLRCATVAEVPVAGADTCEDGTFLRGVEGGAECVRAHEAVSRYAHDRCNLYYGWRDSCDGCTTGPFKLGRTKTVGCTNGGGVDNTCINTTIAGGLLDLFGLNTDGDVGGDDKFYVGFKCEGGTSDTDVVAATCPADKLVTAILEDGSVQCASPALEAETAILNSCHVYYGWRDNCSGCTTPPSKWGRAGGNLCENGVGAANTCNTFELAGVPVPLFGLNTDGDVNGDDKFYVGFQCE